MSKIGPSFNGDLADGMVGSMDARTMRSRDFLREEWNEKVAKVFSCDVDHMYASVNDVQAKDREINALKESLIVNLTLIQHQSDELLARDKEIAALREENDTLRLRFERMERRVTLQRHKDEPGPPLTSSVTNYNEQSGPRSSLPLTIPYETENPSICVKRRRVSQGAPFRRKPRTISSGSDKTKRSRSISESNVLDAERRGRIRPPITSDEPYFTLVGESEPWGPTDLVIDCGKKEEEQVQVPSWREKILSPLYVMEGTEDIQEEAYLKRHQKLENDERRRKRWDIQRIRELSQVERLKQREKRRVTPRTTNSPDRPIRSFHPSPEDVLEVEVSPCLPIVAFGLPLRTFDPCDFSLPWNVQGGSKILNLRSR